MEVHKNNLRKKESVKTRNHSLSFFVIQINNHNLNLFTFYERSNITLKFFRISFVKIDSGGANYTVARIIHFIFKLLHLFAGRNKQDTLFPILRQISNQKLSPDIKKNE